MKKPSRLGVRVVAEFFDKMPICIFENSRNNDGSFLLYEDADLSDIIEELEESVSFLKKLHNPPLHTDA